MVGILEVNSGNWDQEVIHSNVLMVVDFWHEGCPWCVKLNPMLDEASELYVGKIKFAKLNVFASDGDKELTFRYGIMSTPTLVFFCKGRPVGELVGFMSIEQLKKSLDDMLVKNSDCFTQSTDLKT